MSVKFEWVDAATIEIGDEVMTESGKHGEVVGCHHIKRTLGDESKKITVVMVIETPQHSFTHLAIEQGYGIWKRL